MKFNTGYWYRAKPGTPLPPEDIMSDYEWHRLAKIKKKNGQQRLKFEGEKGHYPSIRKGEYEESKKCPYKMASLSTKPYEPEVREVC
jgi:hypothetical protein